MTGRAADLRTAELEKLRVEYPGWLFALAPAPPRWHAARVPPSTRGGVTAVLVDTPEHLRELLDEVAEIDARLAGS